MREGQPAYIIGSGPSLIDFDFSKLDNKFTIAVNHTIEHYDNCNCLIFGDNIFLRTTNYNLDSFNGLIFASRKTMHQPNLYSIKDKENVYFFDDNRREIGVDMAQGLYHPTNTGMLAINLALCMRADPIYLLGFDFKYKNNKMHFYKDYPHHKTYTEEKYKQKLYKFHPFKKYADRIINLNLDSNIDIFPKVHWGAVL